MHTRCSQFFKAQWCVKISREFSITATYVLNTSITLKFTFFFKIYILHFKIYILLIVKIAFVTKMSIHSLTDLYRRNAVYHSILMNDI